MLNQKQVPIIQQLSQNTVSEVSNDVEMKEQQSDANRIK